MSFLTLVIVLAGVRSAGCLSSRLSQTAPRDSAVDLATWGRWLSETSRSHLPEKPFALDAKLRSAEKESPTRDGTATMRVVAETDATSFPEAGLRYARTFLVGGNGPFQVLNYVMYPDPILDYPVFMADLVRMPGQYLFAIDHQPMSEEHRSGIEDTLHGKRLRALEELWHEHQSQMLQSGDIPEAAQQYFTPHAIWARQPLDDPRGDVVFEALKAYFHLYLEYLPPLPKKSASGHEERQRTQEEYCDYRRRNDPGARVLNSIFGTEWTGQLLDEALFPSPL